MGGHSSPARQALSRAAHSWPVAGFLLPPPSLPGEAAVSATCLATGHPSLSFSKSMSRPTFCHPFLLTPRNRPRAPSFSVPKTNFTRRYTVPRRSPPQLLYLRLSSLVQARPAAPPTGDLKEGGKKFGNYSRGYSLAIVKVLYTGLLKSNSKSNKRACCEDHTHAPPR